MISNFYLFALLSFKNALIFWYFILYKYGLIIRVRIINFRKITRPLSPGLVRLYLKTVLSRSLKNKFRKSFVRVQGKKPILSVVSLNIKELLAHKLTIKLNFLIVFINYRYRLYSWEIETSCIYRFYRYRHLCSIYSIPICKTLILRYTRKQRATKRRKHLIFFFLPEVPCTRCSLIIINKPSWYVTLWLWYVFVSRNI